MIKKVDSQKTIWSEVGKDIKYEYYRNSSRSKELREWVDNVLFVTKLIEFLDENFMDKFRNEDFFGRLWELEIVEWLNLTGIKMLPTLGTGPDFCLELEDGSKIWVEAVLSRPDTELEKMHDDSFIRSGSAHQIPNEEIALRYSTSLVAKAEKIKNKYVGIIGPNDYTLIAVSSFPFGSMWPDINMFMPAILPVEFQIVYFSKDGSPLNENVIRPTHSIKREYKKESGAIVKKEFLYPGNYFPYIDGVIFSEASNLQQLLGRYSTAFSESTNRPHIFANYVGKVLPEIFTNNFYNHKFKDKDSMVSLEVINPTIV